MKTLNSTVITIAALFLSGALFFSCSLPGNEGYGTLVITLPGGNAAARAAVSEAFAATLSFHIECNGPGPDDKVTRESRAGASVSIPLNVGDWTVTVTILNAADQIIGSGTERVVIESGRTTPLQMPVTIDTGGNDITGFAITSPVSAEGVINATTIDISVPFRTNLTGMNFTATHTGASISPAPGTPLDFDSPQTVTVRAENGQVKVYTVRVNLSPPPVPDGGTAEWPSVVTWQNYGLSSGLSKPSGTTVSGAAVSSGALLVYLQNADTEAFDNLVSQFTVLDGIPATSSESGYRFYELAYMYSGASFTLSMTYGSGMLILSIEPDDPSGFFVWPGNDRWTVFNLSGLTQPAGTTVADVTETESPTAMLSVTLNNINHTAYEDLLSHITALLGSPYTSTGTSATQTREDVFMSTVGATMLIVTLEMDTSDDEITIAAIKY
jgi:hypothetical protein